MENYNITELKDDWKVSWSIGKVKASYKISKALCSTTADVAAYLKDHKEGMGDGKGKEKN